jgi:hypothetical protein
MFSNIQGLVKQATYSPEGEKALKEDKKEQEKAYSQFRDKLSEAKLNLINYQKQKKDNIEGSKEDIEYFLKEINENIKWLSQNKDASASKINDKYSNLFESVFFKNSRIREEFLQSIQTYRNEIKKVIDSKKPKLEGEKEKPLSTYEKEYIAMVKKETDVAYNWAMKTRLTADKADYFDQMNRLKELLGPKGKEKIKIEATKEDVAKNKFDPWRFAKKTFGILGIIIFVGLFIGFGMFGSSLAINLNAYRSFYYRLFYMIYGFMFSFFVISYVFIYLKWYSDKTIPYFSFIPLFEGCFQSQFLSDYFSWLTFDPDSNKIDLANLANNFYLF